MQQCTAVQSNGCFPMRRRSVDGHKRFWTGNCSHFLQRASTEAGMARCGSGPLEASLSQIVVNHARWRSLVLLMRFDSMSIGPMNADAAAGWGRLLHLNVAPLSSWEVSQPRGQLGRAAPKVQPLASNRTVPTLYTTLNSCTTRDTCKHFRDVPQY